MITFYKEEGGRFSCTICPHNCLLKPGELGFCKVRRATENGIEFNAYGKLTHIAVEPIEKKPITEFLPGTKALSLSGIGCNLVCGFCENSAYSQNGELDKTKYFSPQSIIDLAIDKECSSVCMTYTEPIIYYEYLLDVAEECHKNDLYFIIKTAAYVNKEPWRIICENTDVMNIDWKGSGKEAKKVIGFDHFCIFDRIKEAIDLGVHVEISIPLYHNILKGGGFEVLGKNLKDINPDIPIHLLRVYPSNRHERYPATPDEVIFYVIDILSLYLNNIYSPLACC